MSTQAKKGAQRPNYYIWDPNYNLSGENFKNNNLLITFI